MALGWMLLSACAVAQSTRIVPPSLNPVRPVPGATVEPREPKVRQVTYLVLSESRPWTSADGKVIEAKLVAFEEMVVEGTRGDPATPDPVPPRYVTVVREGKIRLLVGRKVSLVPLERLAEADREFVEKVRARREKDGGKRPGS